MFEDILIQNTKDEWENVTTSTILKGQKTPKTSRLKRLQKGHIFFYEILIQNTKDESKNVTTSKDPL